MNLTLIIPVFGVEKYIEDCLNSIYSTSVNFEFEVIIVNDCTTDSSISIVEQFVLKNNITNLSIIHHEVNKGLGASRNTGITKASNEYIWFIDSDDSINISELDKIIGSARSADVITFGVNTAMKV